MPDGQEFDSLFAQWLEESVGIPRKLLASLDKDDDWTFVIKMHGILEAGLNHLLLTHLGNPDLRQVISKLDTSKKLAFIKAAKLLNDEALIFGKLFSALRGTAVHDIKNFDLNLVEHLKSLNGTEQHNWGKALTSWCPTLPSKESTRSLALRIPRAGIQNSVMGIMLKCLQHEKKYDAIQEMFLKHVELISRSESTPTE